MLENEKPIPVVKKIFVVYYLLQYLFFLLCIYIVHAHRHTHTNILTLTTAKFATFPLKFSLGSNPNNLFGYMQISSHCHDAVGESFVC